MYELLAKAIEALAGYQLVQAAVAVLVLLAGLFIMKRGERDRKLTNGTQVLPAWTLYGPVHEAMQSVHNISESCRSAVKSLESIEKEAREQTQLLEDIRNNQVMHRDPPAPVRRR